MKEPRPTCPVGSASAVIQGHPAEPVNASALHHTLEGMIIRIIDLEKETHQYFGTVFKLFFVGDHGEIDAVGRRVRDQQVGEGRNSHQVAVWVGGDEADLVDRPSLAEEETVAVATDGLQSMQKIRPEDEEDCQLIVCRHCKVGHRGFTWLKIDVFP